MNIFKRQSKISKEIQKASSTNLDLELGNYVLHTLTGMCGIVIDKSHSMGKQWITVETSEGRTFRNLDRQEFRLCDKGYYRKHAAEIKEIAVQSVKQVVIEVPAEPMPKIDASHGVDNRSILNDLAHW